jgi:hypothetical protein
VSPPNHGLEKPKGSRVIDLNDVSA